jgi:DNA polymerase III subunit epsilon
MKILFFDLETTGVKFWRNGIHQMSGIIDIDGKDIETFDIKLQPSPAAEIEDEALQVSGLTREILASYQDQKSGYLQLVAILSKYVDKYNKTDKFFLAGYNNASFDNQFLRALFTQCNDNYFGSWFWSNSIDVMCSATEYLINKRCQMIDFKLKTVIKELGIELDESKLHDAVYDIQKTREIFYKIKR